MKVILSVPDEGYSRNASCALNVISKFSDKSFFSCCYWKGSENGRVDTIASVYELFPCNAGKRIHLHAKLSEVIYISNTLYRY